MKKRKLWLVILMAVIVLAAAGIYIAGRLGVIGEGVMMLALLPLMLGMICVACLIYAAWASDEHKS